MKIHEQRTVPVDIGLTRQDTRETADDFSLILDKAVAKTHEDTLTYEQELLKRDQSEQAAFAVLPFIPQQIMDMQTIPLQQQSPPAINATVPGDPSSAAIGPSTPVAKETTALQPMTQQVFQQLTKVFDKPGAIVQPGMELRSLFAKAKQVVPVIPFDQLYAELVKHAKTMKQGSTLRLKLALEPDKLGTIDVYMVLDSKQQLAVMFAAQEDTRKLLESSGQDLQTLLAQNGYSLNDMQFMSFSGSGHQALEEEFQESQNSHNDAEMLNILGQTDIINSVNAHLASVVVNYVT